MQSAMKAFRDGFAPLLSERALWALLGALERDDPRLIQGSTSRPPPLQSLREWSVEACCAITYAGWKGDQCGHWVGDVDEFFVVACYHADEALGEPGACRWFLNWFDTTPRDEMRRELAAEIRNILTIRERATA